MTRTLLFSLFSLLIAINVQAAAVKTGLWEMRVETRIEGMQGNLPPQTIQQCVTSKNMIPGDVEKDGCRVSNVKVSGGNVSWNMSCSEKMGNLKGKGRMTYNGSTMHGESRLSMKQAGQTMTMTQIYKGKRIGKCKK